MNRSAPAVRSGKSTASSNCGKRNLSSGLPLSKIFMSLVLGIDTSCDETSAAVLADGEKILSNVISSQVELHAPHGGVVPEIASRSHLTALPPVVDKALSDA